MDKRIKTEKESLRKAMLTKRSEMKASEREEASRKIVLQIIESDYFQNASVIFAFLPFREEVNIDTLVEQCWKDGKKVYVPKVNAKQKIMQFFEIHSFEDVAIGHYGIREPKEHCPSYKGGKLDLVLMPGVAFDRHMMRLGYGAGYYDRYLSQLISKPFLLAPAYAMQVVEQVPCEPWDIPLDAIVTEEGWIHT